MEKEDSGVGDGKRILEGKNYIIIKGSFMKLARMKAKKQCQFGRCTVDLAELIGHPVGTQFKLHPISGKRMMHPEPVERTEDLAEAIAAEESGADNRNLVPDQTSQAMTREQIMEMRDQGATGKEIISSIIDNSTSFQGKTEYSQAKYVRKKQKKYFEFISVHEPSVRLVASMYYMQDPLKIMNLRVDSLSQLLTSVGVRAGGRYLLLESGCVALTIAAVLERMAGRGHLVHLFQGGKPQRHAVEAMNFTSDQLSCLTCVDLRTLLSRHPADPTVTPDPAVTADTASEPAADRVAAEAPAETSSVATPQNGHTAQKDGSQPETVKADGVPTSAEENATSTGGDGVTPTAGERVKEEVEVAEEADVTPAGDDVTPSGDDVTEGSVETAETVKEDQGVDNSAPESKKRRLSGEPAGPVERKRKYARTLDEDCDLALRVLSSRNMDGLLVCCRQHPLNLLRYLLRFLAVSRPFAVFCPYKEPLLECYFAMKAEGCIMLKVTETWLRNYQVLPERTHPEINMSGGGGYILSGIKVDRSLNRSVVTD